MFNIDFEEWSNLYKNDPEAFEKKRLETLKAFIDENAIDDASRLKLEQTLFRIEMTRKKSKSPLQGAIEASKLMWESANKLQTHVGELHDQIDDCFNQPGDRLRLIETTPTQFDKKKTEAQANSTEMSTTHSSQRGAKVYQLNKQSGFKH